MTAPGTRRQARPLLVVISGPSGSGKTTITKRLMARNGYWLSVSATTRPPRPGEVDGRDYLFMSREKFLEGVRQGGFLEYSEHFGHLYGTPRKPVDDALAKGKVALLEIDVNGARQARESLAGRVRTLLIFINAPSDQELRRRILQRPGTQDDRVARERLARAEMEIAQSRFFDHEVVNDDVEKAVRQVEKLIRESV